MAKRICGACGEETSILGGRIDEQGAFTCADCLQRIYEYQESEYGAAEAQEAVEDFGELVESTDNHVQVAYAEVDEEAEKSGRSSLTEAMLLWIGDGSPHSIVALTDEALQAGLSVEDQTKAHLIKGTTLFYQSDFEAAEREIRKAVDIDPTLVTEGHCVLGWKTLAQIREFRDDLTGAVECYRQALVHLQEHSSGGGASFLWPAHIHYDLSTFYQRHSDEITGASKKALASAMKASEIAPRYPEPYFILGALHFIDDSIRDLAQAKEYYEKCLFIASESERSLDPDNRSDMVKLAKNGLSLVKEKMEEEEDECFIATAACGSAAAPDVIVLREFRDARLKETSIGALLIHAYESWSPALARSIADRPRIRRVVRQMIIAPAARIAGQLLNETRIDKTGEGHRRR